MAKLQNGVHDSNEMRCKQGQPFPFLEQIASSACNSAQRRALANAPCDARACHARFRVGLLAIQTGLNAVHIATSPKSVA